MRLNRRHRTRTKTQRNSRTPSSRLISTQIFRRIANRSQMTRLLHNPRRQSHTITLNPMVNRINFKVRRISQYILPSIAPMRIMITQHSRPSPRTNHITSMTHRQLRSLNRSNKHMTQLRRRHRLTKANQHHQEQQQLLLTHNRNTHHRRYGARRRLRRTQRKALLPALSQFHRACRD